MFFVLATQNPVEQHGTFPLPEAQLDRFMMRLSLGTPTLEEEIKILNDQRTSHPLDTLAHTAGKEDVLSAQEEVKSIFVSEDVTSYIVELTAHTRSAEDCLLGASPRASLAVRRAAQALALLEGDRQATPHHVKTVFPGIVNHRLLLHPEAKLSGRKAGAVIEHTLHSVDVPYD